ncbi:MAG TPA: hypothetical protein VMT22_21545 [Terriglobales bacterium]|jgi:2-hydroxychromene-2-carboxylate isomerase|nr:hypothetical protein [Terriglobales bacterium]
MRIEAVAQGHQIDIDRNAFLLEPIFKAQGWGDSPFNIYPAKGRYMQRDLTRICEAPAIPFAWPYLRLTVPRIAHRHPVRRR